MKKLLQINSVVNTGSTGRIAEEIGQVAMTQGWNSYIAYRGVPTRESNSTLIRIGNNWNFYLHALKGRVLDKEGFGSKSATKKFLDQIERINPDIIALHNLHGHYINIRILFNYLKELNVPIFWTLYDCWAFTGHCAYFDMINCDNWKRGCYDCPCKNSYPKSFIIHSHKNYKTKKSLFTDIKKMQLIVHSNWLKKNISQSFLKDYPVNLIRNGVNLSKFKFISSNKIRKKYNLEDKYIILGVANRWETRKGIRDFILLNEYLNSNETIVIVGLTESQQRSMPANICCLERTESVEELAELYSIAGVFFNPTYEDNFPTTNLESLACGTPVITYDTGGSPEAIDSKTGFIVEKGEVRNAYSFIQQIKTEERRKYRYNCTVRAKEFFNCKDRYLDYLSLFENTLYRA